MRSYGNRQQMTKQMQGYTVGQSDGLRLARFDLQTQSFRVASFEDAKAGTRIDLYIVNR